MIDNQKMIIDIILNSDFFPQDVKNEVKNFNNWGYKITTFEFQRNIKSIKNDETYGPTLGNKIKISNDVFILNWDNGFVTSIPLLNKHLKEFNLYDEICKYKEGKG